MHIFFLLLEGMNDKLVVQLHSNSRREKLIPCITIRSCSPKGTWEKHSRFGHSVDSSTSTFHLVDGELKLTFHPTEYNDYEINSKRSTLWFQRQELNLPRSDNASLGEWATFWFNKGGALASYLTDRYSQSHSEESWLVMRELCRNDWLWK